MIESQQFIYHNGERLTINGFLAQHNVNFYVIWVEENPSIIETTLA